LTVAEVFANIRRLTAEPDAHLTSGVPANLPNAISAARLLATPILLFAAIWGHRDVFTWLLLGCLLSDIADGLIARGFHLVSRIGAFLDSTADIATTVVAIVGIASFERGFLSAHAMPLLFIIGLYVAEVAAALWRYGRISSFHTQLSRAAAYAQGAFIMSLLVWGDMAWLFAGVVALSAAAYLEEILLVIVLPQWTADVGGLARVVRERRAEHR
jgi:CDP-diacylglycerol--glycerol-3-phosphate 3-phosphatidyltransferase